MNIEKEICNYWLRGDCLYGEKCRLLHPPQLLGALSLEEKRNIAIENVHMKKKERKNLSKTKNDNNDNNDNDDKTTTSLRVKRHNKRRDSIFRYWILDTFGRCIFGDDDNKEKPMILDVAGGKGVLSFELLNLNNIDSIVVDPRPSLNVERHEKALLKGFLHKNPKICEKYIYNSYQTCADDGAKTPQHLRLFFDDSLWTLPLDKLVEYQFCKIASFENNNNNDNDKIRQQIKTDCEKIKQYLIKCKGIIGMHPDIATEPIIDYSLQNRKFFAVLPCCVFPKSFPNRKLKLYANNNGDNKENNNNEYWTVSVKNYTQFCEYLKQKHVEIQEDKLSRLDGKNRIIYYIPP